MKKRITSALRHVKSKLIVSLLLLSSLSTQAQFFDRLANPQIRVKIDHPPTLGIKINKVAIGNVTGTGADQVSAALVADFVTNNIEVIDRENLQTILAEHKLNLSGFVDRSKAAEIGKILGPSAIINVNVLRFESKVDENLTKTETYRDSKTKTNYSKTVYISRTKFYLKVSIQTTDLTTGKIFAARVIESSPEKENKSYEGRIEAPDANAIQDLALEEVSTEAHRMYIPWSTEPMLYYYDDKDGNLKQAFLALKGGDIPQALELSKQNVEVCKGNPQIKEKTLAHAYYNLGMSYMTINDYDNAILNLKEAQKIKPGSIITESIAECTKAKQLVAETKLMDEKESLELANQQAKEAQNAKAIAANTLTNADIVMMTKKKLPKALISQKIKTSVCKFDCSTNELAKLTAAGVSESIILQMMEK